MIRKTTVAGAVVATVVWASPAQAVSISVVNFQFQPSTVTDSQGGVVTWNFSSNNGSVSHSATDTSGMSLYDSGLKAAGTSFSHTFTAAGIYTFHCKVHSSMTGSVKVPVQASPTSGTTATTFTITWSSGAAASGFVFDVQILKPGTTIWASWKTGVTGRSATFKPANGTGTYKFRARLRKTAGGASKYSPAKAITVS